MRVGKGSGKAPPAPRPYQPCHPQPPRQPTGRWVRAPLGCVLGGSGPPAPPLDSPLRAPVVLHRLKPSKLRKPVTFASKREPVASLPRQAAPSPASHLGSPSRVPASAPARPGPALLTRGPSRLPTSVHRHRRLPGRCGPPEWPQACSLCGGRETVVKRVEAEAWALLCSRG